MSLLNLPKKGMGPAVSEQPEGPPVEAETETARDAIDLATFRRIHDETMVAPEVPAEAPAEEPAQKHKKKK